MVCFLSTSFLSFQSFQMAFLSSELTLSLKTLSAEIAEASEITYEKCATFAASVATIAAAAAATAAAAAAAPATAEKPAKKIKKATTVKPAAVDEAKLLAPVDALASPAVASVEVIRDPYATHKHRVAKIDPLLCISRKIDEKNPIEGTRKGDTGAVNKMFPEKQCSKKPLPGQKFCKTCSEKEDEAKKDLSKRPNGYFGRLDETTLYPMAPIIGSACFFEKYPKGLVNDPTTAPIPVVEAAAVEAAPATKAKKPRAKKEKAVAPVVENTMIAATGETPVKPWVTFMYEGRVVIRNEADGRTYEADTTKTEREQMAKKDQCIGRWQDGALNIYADEEDDA